MGKDRMVELQVSAVYKAKGLVLCSCPRYPACFRQVDSTHPKGSRLLSELDGSTLLSELGKFS